MLSEDAKHALGVMSSVNGMRLEEFICDFKIISGSETFKTHRLILAANSGYFKSLFSSNMKEAEQGFISITSIESNILKQCIHYMYTSYCEIQSSSVSEILGVSNFLQISTLEQKCFDFLHKSLSPENSLVVLELARMFHNQNLESAAERVVHNNLDAAITSELFSKLDKHDMWNFIADADCKTAWRAISTWSQGKETEFIWLLQQTDFSQYHFNFLLEDVLQDPLVTSQNAVSHVIPSLFYDEESLKHNLNIQNCFQIYQYAVQYLEIEGVLNDSVRLNKLAADIKYMTVIRSFMEMNFPSVISEPGFGSLSIEEVKMLLNSSDITSEEPKWQGILAWIKSDIDQRKIHFASLFSLLKLHVFPVTYLRYLSREELVKGDSECMNILLDVLFEQKFRDTTSQEQSDNVNTENVYDTMAGDGNHKAFDEDPIQEDGDDSYSNFSDSDLMPKTPPLPAPRTRITRIVDPSRTVQTEKPELKPCILPVLPPLMLPLPGDQEPVWVSSEEVSRCRLCDQKFGLFTRRNHCRSCGDVFCGSCCSEKCQLKYLDNKEDRVCSDCSREIKAGPREATWELPKRYFTDQMLVHSGRHSDVYKALWNGHKEVAIKSMKVGTVTKEEFIAECEILKRLRHENIVCLLGNIAEDPTSIVMEFMSKVNLAQYLRCVRYTKIDHHINMASQIAAALTYLESVNCVHCCIMARNILVNEHLICKLSGFRMARITENGMRVWVNAEEEVLPVRWTAPETFTNGESTIKADVWSFGVVMYEIVTRGKTPYFGMHTSEVYPMVKSGYRMEKPENCPDSLYEIILQCWREEPTRRPTFEFLQGYLEDYFNAAEDPYLVSKR